MVEEEGIDGKAKEEKLDGEAQAEEQIPKNLHGYWVKCHIRDTHIQALESEGTVAPQEESHWQTDFKAPVLAPNPTEILMLKSHVERGLSLPPSCFFMNLLKYYGLQLHHTAQISRGEGFSVCGRICSFVRGISWNSPPWRLVSPVLQYPP
jgi:hypothetical protein